MKTAKEIIEEINDMEYAFHSQNSHIPEVLLLGENEYSTLVEYLNKEDLFYFSPQIRNLIRYKQFDIYEVKQESLIKMY